MKTVAQWAEQLPELIRIEFIKECKTHQLNLKRKRENLSEVFWLSFWWLESYTELGSEFWGFVKNSLIDPTYADYLDENVPYTKEEVEAMILEYADPNDEVCKVMLWNLAKPNENVKGKPNFHKGGNMQGFLEKQNEVLKSNIEGLASENAELISETQRLNTIVDNQKLDIDLLRLEIKEHEKILNIKNQTIAAWEKIKLIITPQPKPSLLQRLINWIF